MAKKKVIQVFCARDSLSVSITDVTLKQIRNGLWLKQPSNPCKDLAGAINHRFAVRDRLIGGVKIGRGFGRAQE